MAFEIFLIRKFERALLELWSAGCVHGPLHTSIGYEACAAGTMAALQATDKISSTHLRNATIGVIGTNAIVAGGVPLATGAAFAAKYRHRRDVIVAFLGDGAVNQGAFHEAVNLAGIWRLPVVYFIENNLYAVGTAAQDATATPDLAVKAAAYGIPGVIVDGMDPLAVYLAVTRAAKTARDGHGPTLIEAKCYRFHHHAGPLAGSNFGYRGKQEETDWLRLDPYKTFPQKLIARGLLTPTQVETLQQHADALVDASLAACTIRNGDRVCVKENLWPDISTLETGLRSPGREFSSVTFREKNDFTEFERKTYVEAIAAVTGRWLEKDENTFVIGEEIANFGGGPYGAAKGLPAKYPDRVLNTPISEAGFTGLAGGAAMSGLRPVVEIMFPDFALVAADQLFNQIGKLRHIYGDSTAMPLVVRTRIAIGCGYGGQHSMDPVGLFSLFSGWTVVAPADAFDYIGLFNSAMQSLNPVLIVEHHELYPQPCEVPKDDLDYFIPLGVKPGC